MRQIFLKFIAVTLQRLKVSFGKNIWKPKFRVFWDVARCSHVEVHRRFSCAYYLHHHSHCPDGDSTNLRNVAQLQRDYMALLPRRLHTRRREKLKAHIWKPRSWIRVQVLWTQLIYCKRREVVFVIKWLAVKTHRGDEDMFQAVLRS
jgi:hypothetical protein